MKKIHILFVYNGHISYYPPFLAILDYLTDIKNYDVTILASEHEEHTQKIYEAKGVNIISLYDIEPARSYLAKARNMYKRKYVLKKKIDGLVSKIDYDILWIVGEETGVKIAKFLEGKKYIQSVYELGDVRSKLFLKNYPVIHNAKVNVACEYNRSQIMRAWYNLEDLPVVLPNKPYEHPRRRFLPCDYEEQLKDKKIILYQGHIMRERNLDGICEASLMLKDYTLVLMGGGSRKGYEAELRTKYPNVIFINHIKAPYHLNITSYARIGIVTYNTTSLNNIYCAPNKIWEYAGFGIPMLANDIPGLKDTVEKNQAGICLDMDNPDDIVKAVEMIEKNYELYSRNAEAMYDACSIGTIVETVISKYNK